MAAPGSRWLTWLLLAAPGVWWVAAWSAGGLVYGEFVHLTGLGALLLVLAAMAVTPACQWLPRGGLSRWLRRSRRYIGIASFLYLLLHAAAYCVRQPWSRIVEEGASGAFATGWIALVIMFALAATSNDCAVRMLGVRWKRLHRLVYLAAFLTLVHWVLTAFDPTQAYVTAGVLLLIEAARFVPRPGPSSSGRGS